MKFIQYNNQAGWRIINARQITRGFMQSSNTNSFFNPSIAIPPLAAARQPALEAKQSTTQSPAPAINYIWIGPASSIPGHDIGGPIAMAEANIDNPNANPIVFWCLEKYRSEYENKFKDYNIQVRSIESQIHLAENSGSPDLVASARLLKNIYETCLNDDRNSIRDRVTFKDAASFFLLQSVGGYVIDTNVLPIEQKPFTLPAFDVFQAPSTNFYIAEPGHLECWMLYAPGKENNQAKEMLRMYHAKWEAAEKIRKETLLDNYQDALGHAVMDPIFKCYSQHSIETFSTKPHRENFYRDILNMNLRKTYSNTHRETKTSEIFYLTLGSNIPQLRAFIRHGGNVNEKIITPEEGFYKDETALYLAIRSRCRPEIIRMLLEAGANPDAEVVYHSKITTPREMMPLINKEYLAILQTIEAEKAVKKIKQP
jgi:hypothetical protein